jgi:hypothetical protein
VFLGVLGVSAAFPKVRSQKDEWFCFSVSTDRRSSAFIGGQ